MRRLGSPNTTPTAAAQSPPMAKAPMIGMPGMRSTALYAMKDHRHERGGAERELPGVAGEDVQPERGEREDQKRRDDGGEPVLVANERHHPEGYDQEQRYADAVLPDRKDLLILGVARL